MNDDCKVCDAHRGLVTRVNVFTVLFALIIVVVLACAGIAWAARTEASNVGTEFKVHAADQGRRITNIEQGVARNEKALQRIENRLDELLSQ